MSLVALSTLAEVEAVIEQTHAMEREEDRIKVLSGHIYLAEDMPCPPADPLSADYLGFVLSVWQSLSGKSQYQPEDCEASPFLAEPGNIFQLSPYDYRSSEMLGDFLITHGFIIRTMGVKGGAKILEYGAGNGQILLQLARIGCDVTAIDIEPRYIELIQRQADAMSVPIRGIVGTFAADPPDPPYDVVLFFAAFHHSLDHIRLIERLSGMVRETGALIFSGEPIISVDSPWRPVIPYPWGPRLDLLSIRAMRMFGWMELGFHEEYFCKLLDLYGWHATKYPCALTGLAETWVARRR